MVTAYLKRCVALVTASVHRYRSDSFFRTEVHIIALQVVFVSLLLAVISVSAGLLYHNVSYAVLRGLSETLASNAMPDSVAGVVLIHLNQAMSRTVAFVIVMVLLTTIVFNYLIIHVALQPIRNVLRSQKQFIGNVAHELRTPLSVIKTNIEVALMSLDEKSELHPTLTSIVEEVNRVSEIINNLLSLSASLRPERIEFQEVNLNTVVEGVAQKLRALTESSHLEMEMHLSEPGPVWGNATALEQIVMNIIKNAILYSPQDSHIVVTVEPTYHGFVRFAVQDSGKGIARKDLYHIFEPYYRADPARGRFNGGSGLGLTIVSELVKLHNGKITVRSSEGRGTTVTVHLPISKQAASTESKVEEEDKSANEVTVDFSANGASFNS